MEKITQSITLDLVEISHNVVNARQGDRLTRDLIITITNNGKDYEIPNSSYVYLRGKRADGGSVFYSVTMKDMNTVHVDIHDYLMSYPGRCKLDIGIYDRIQSDSGNDSDEIASTEPFILYIPDEVFDENAIVDSDEGSALSQLIHSARDQIDEMNHLEDVISENEKNRTNAEDKRIVNENIRISNEEVRENQESNRQINTSSAIKNAEKATKLANDVVDDLQNKLDSHHFLLTEDKDVANGVPSLDANTKVPNVELYEATVTGKGITQLTDSVSSNSTTTAATPNSIKIVNDDLLKEIERAKAKENEIVDNLSTEVTRATNAENNVVSNHNASTTAHSDIRDLISSLTTRLNALADSHTHPTYTEATALTKLTSGEKISVAFGKISKAVTDLISHLADTVKHITGTERTNWNSAYSHSTSAHAPSNAEVNQNAFSNVTVENTTIAADSKTDTLTIVTGSNITLTPDATNDKITISSMHPDISKSVDTTSTASPSSGGTFTTIDSVSRDNNGHVTKVNTKTVTLPSTSIVVDSTLSSTSTNPVENRIVNTALNNKLPLSGGTMTGTLNLKPNVYDEGYSGALNAQNSNIYGINSLLFADLCDSAKEGIQFYRTGTSVDTLWGKNGVLYWTPNRTFGTVGNSNYEILNSNNYTSYCAKASHAHSYLPLSGGNMTGTIYFTGDHNSSDNYGYISHNDNTLTIKAPSNNGSGMGLEFRSCASGILPTYATLKGSQNLGSSSQSFGNIYSNGATVSTSDQKEKKDIVPLKTELDTFNSIFDRINFIKYRWKDNHNGALESSPSRRYHYGIIAQEVEHLMHEYGLTNYDNGFIHSNFFLDNTTKCYITGGYRSPKDGYDYSQNVWNYKNDEEYEIFNEVIEESFANLNRGDKYKHRPEIQYILIQDISKVRTKGKQPPVTINSITLVDKEGNQAAVPLTADGGIACYSPDDENFETPGSHATMNENGSITISFDDMWCSYMLKIADDENCFNIYDYESIIADVDYIGEYKIYLIPKGNYLTCDFWNDRDRTDQIAYDYSFNYQEFTNMCLAVLQQTRKDYIDYKTSSEFRICELETKISQLEECIKNPPGGD